MFRKNNIHRLWYKVHKRKAIATVTYSYQSIQFNIIIESVSGDIIFR